MSSQCGDNHCVFAAHLYESGKTRMSLHQRLTRFMYNARGFLPECRNQALRAILLC
jgi:hypothetical protein